MKYAVLSFTCGLFLPLWWLLLSKKPPIFTFAVDEHGVVSKTQNEVTKNVNGSYLNPADCGA